MPDKIKLLAESLIEERGDLALEVLGASSRLGTPLGWHYLLDIIWILSELDLPEGATVLDAGAGLGLLQFLLADRGYRVISADMSVRTPPNKLEGLYRFELLGSETGIEHDYLKHHGWAGRPAGGQRMKGAVRGLLATPLGEIPRKIAERMGASGRMKTSPTSEGPSDRPPRDLPIITFYRCDLKQMPELGSGTIDAVVSVSALEHNPADGIGPILREFERIAKPHAAALMTISACRSGAQFHEPSHSHLLDDAGIREAYALAKPESDFDRFDDVFESLRQSRYLRRWLGSFYYQSEKNGMPWGVWAPQYQPVGVRKEFGGDKDEHGRTRTSTDGQGITE